METCAKKWWVFEVSLNSENADFSEVAYGCYTMPCLALKSWEFQGSKEDSLTSSQWFWGR